jgi:hypothetical protein
VGKSLFSILICILFFFCASEEAQGCAWPDGENTATLVSVGKADVLTTSTDAHPSAIEQKAKRVIPASRCCHLVKYVSSNSIALSFLTACSRQALPCSTDFTAAKSNHLSHIYPFHNFW